MILKLFIQANRMTHDLCSWYYNVPATSRFLCHYLGSYISSIIFVFVTMIDACSHVLCISTPWDQSCDVEGDETQSDNAVACMGETKLARLNFGRSGFVVFKASKH